MSAQNSYKQLAKAYTSPSGTNLIEYYPGGGQYLKKGDNQELQLFVSRTAETGVSTLDVGIEFYNPVTGNWNNLLDQAGAAVGIVQYIDGAVDTTGYRSLRIRPGSLGADVDGVLIYGTNYKTYDLTVPLFFRVKVTNGGTTVTNTYSLLLQMLT